MVVREPKGMRKAVLAGAVALTLTGAGVAIAGADDAPSPNPLPSQSAPGNSGIAPGQNKPDKARRPMPLHGEEVVKNADGTIRTKLEQRGTVESVSESAITVKSEDGFSRTYAVNGDTKTTVFPAPANSSGATPGATRDAGKRLRPTDGTIADIAAGDVVRIAGVKDGDKAAATRIVKGAGDGPGLGLGRGLGRGLGHSQGLGHKMGKGNHQDDQDS